MTRQSLPDSRSPTKAVPLLAHASSLATVGREDAQGHASQRMTCVPQDRTRMATAGGGSLLFQSFRELQQEACPLDTKAGWTINLHKSIFTGFGLR